jgi:hypothetical protein
VRERERERESSGRRVEEDFMCCVQNPVYCTVQDPAESAYFVLEIMRGSNIEKVLSSLCS